MPQGIIFDIDGTLVDSVLPHAQSWQRILARYGCDASLEQVRLQIGKGGDHLLPVFLPPDVVAAKGEEIEAARATLFKAEYLPHIKAFPAVRGLFERIVRDGKRIALASSAKGDELETYKRIAGIDDLIATATSSDDAERSKPDPDIFSAALQRLDLPADQAMVIGDSPYDAEAAGKIGIGAVGVLCGGFPPDMLRDAGFIALYQDPADILGGYDNSPLARP